MKTDIVKYTVSEASKIDRDIHELVRTYSAVRVGVGLKMAELLKRVEDNALYLKLDESAYPNFLRYVESLGIAYKTARELIGLYECYVEAAGFSIDFLAKSAYHKLTVIKPKFFEKKNGQYKLTEPKSELKKWIADTQSDLTIDDLVQKRRESEVGEHKHDFETLRFRICKICKLKERY